MSAIRSQSRVSRDAKRGRRMEVRFVDTDKVYRMERDKVEKFGASGSQTFGIPLVNCAWMKVLMDG